MTEPLALALAGERVVLHPERALELPDRCTLVIADVHWGKATALRAQGVPVPAGGTSYDLARLDTVLARTGATSLLVLGDLAHSRHGWEPRALQPVQAWRARWPSLDITLVRGNHDAHAGDPPAALEIRVVDAPLALGALACAHEPPAHPTTRLTLCGHLHPTVRLSGRGADRVRLPCFVHTAHAFILPAFSAFTGGGAWHPAVGDRAYAVAGDAVIETF